MDQLLVLAHFFIIAMGSHLQGKIRLLDLAWHHGNGNVMNQIQKLVQILFPCYLGQL
jgi:hypothetical protein